MLLSGIAGSAHPEISVSGKPRVKQYSIAWILIATDGVFFTRFSGLFKKTCSVTKEIYAQSFLDINYASKPKNGERN